MKIKMLLAAVLLALASLAIAPASAGAYECVADTGVGVVDDKVVGDTCWDCGFLMVRGKVIYNFPCGP